MRTSYAAWNGNPPNIQYYATPMPDAPFLPLTGCGGTARSSLKDFLKVLERDMTNQQGHFFEYVWGSEKEEADTYSLQGWEIFRPDNGSFEALVILYYAPINEYMTLLKHFGQDLADEYIAAIAEYDMERADVVS